MKEQSFSIYFYTKKRKSDESVLSIYLRVTVDGIPKEMGISRKIEENKWNKIKQIAIGKSKECVELNNYLDSIRTKIYKFQRTQQDYSIKLTAQSIINHLQGKDIIQIKSFFDLFQEHNDRYKKLVGVEIDKVTWGRYERTLRYLKEFTLSHYKKTDLPVDKLTPDFVSNFEVFLKVEKGCGDNATKRHLKNTKKIVVSAIDNDYMNKNPFSNKKLGEKAAKISFLTLNEVKAIISKDINVVRVGYVRDAFIFCCFTGLAYTDAYHLRQEDIVIDDNGKEWIIKERIKTGTRFTVPLMDVPKIIIDKYKNNPICKKRGTLLPLPTNQCMNLYLKELADICKIRTRITSHTARHTFASTIALANKVSMQNICRMLGHSSVKMTEHYAQTQNDLILKEMIEVNNTLMIGNNYEYKQ